MKLFSQRLFHYVLVHQFDAIRSLELDRTDLIGMTLLSVLVEQRFVVHPELSELEAKPYIAQHLRQYFDQSAWYRSVNHILLALLLRLGSEDYRHETGVYYPRYKVYFPNKISSVYLTKPRIREFIENLKDDKNQLPFLDLFKGIWLHILEDDKLSNRYLNNVIDPDRKRIAHYYRMKNDLRLGHMDAVRVSIQALQDDPKTLSWMMPGLLDAQKKIDKFYRLDFFEDIKSLYEMDKIQAYITNVFDLSLWQSADPKTKKMVSTAFYLTSRMSRLFDDGPFEDYSSFALPFVKAYEHECYKFFFRGFIQYLKKENVSPQQSIPRHSKYGRYFAIVKMDEQPLQYQETTQENFTLGNVTYILDINHRLVKSAIDSIDPSGLTIAPHFEAYWEKRTKRLPASLQGRAVLIDFAKKAFLISKMRNKMTHAETLTLDDFKSIVAWILESKHLQHLMQINREAS
jgi:hypothetical protein